MTISPRTGLVAPVVALGALAFSGASHAANPGCILYTDPPGDVSVVAVDPGQPGLDILSGGIAAAGDNIAFYLEMADLSSPPPQTHWPIRFSDAAGNTHRVYMQTDFSGAVSFHYITTAAGAVSGLPDVLLGVQDAHADSNYTADGLITIVVPASAFSGDLSGFDTRVVYNYYLPGSGLTPDNAPDDLEPVGTFNGGSCTGGKGALTAAEAEGSAPMQVHYDASQTVAGTEGLQAYVYDFGDGNTLTTTAAHVSHTYAQPGTYTATVRPVDAQGRMGEVGSQQIQVSGAASSAGGLGWGGLILLLAGAARRRRA